MCSVPPKLDSEITAPVVRFEPLLNSNEAADLLGIHPKTLQRMARQGEVVGIRIGRLWRFRASELNEWLQRISGVNVQP
jgi:excisionase family DNA binding protein